MVHKYLVITILTILLFGTISSLLVSYDYSGNGTVSSSSNSAFAAKAQKKSGDSGTTVVKSESPETLQQQEKVAQLLQEASDARLDAKLGQDAANNATENAKSLRVAAFEADKKVAKIQLAENDSDNNDLLSAALTDAKEKHQAASLAEKNAKTLSDKSDALDKAADKAGKLGVRAQKHLESIIAKNGNDLASDIVGQGKASTGVEDQNNISSTASSTGTKIDNGNASSSSDKQLGKEKRMDSGVSKNSDKEVSESNGESTTNTNEGVGESSSTSNAGPDITMNNNTNISEGGLEGKLEKGNSSFDLSQLLAQAEQNAHSANTNVTENANGLISPEANKGAAIDNNSNSSSNALAINPTDSLNIQPPKPGNSLSPENSSVTAIDSSPFQSENQTTLYGGIQKENDTVGENVSTTASNSNGTGNSTTNIIQTGLPGNNSSVLNAVNSTGPIQEDAICNIAIDNSTSSLPSNSGFNMSENKQDDGGCYPNSSTSGQFRYLVWSEGDEDNRFILFKRSTDGGKTFDNAITLSGDVPSAVFSPKLSAEGSNVFVVWQGDSNSGNQDIYLRKSTDNGKTFASVINLSNDHAGSGNPEINVNASSVHVVWDGTTPGNNEIFYRRSLNNGSNFDSVRNLSNDGGVSYEPKVVVNKNALEVYWHDYKSGRDDILAKRSINEGKTFDVLQKISKDVLGLWKDRGGLDSRLNR
jgi:hypothetical protein